MQPVNDEVLERLKREAEAQGKDTSKLRQRLGEVDLPTMGETKQVGNRLILSTGPAREEDFN